jgi:hypothetical protein
MGLIKWYYCNFTDLKSHIASDLQDNKFKSLKSSEINGKVTTIFDNFFQGSTWFNDSKKSAIKSCIKEYVRAKKVNEIALFMDIYSKGHFSGTDEEYKNYECLSREEVDFMISNWVKIGQILNHNGIEYINNTSEINTIDSDDELINSSKQNENEKFDNDKVKKVFKEYSKLCAKFYLDKIDKKFNSAKRELILSGANFCEVVKNTIKSMRKTMELEPTKQGAEESIKSFVEKTLAENCINTKIPNKTGQNVDFYSDEEKETFREFDRQLKNQKLIDRVNTFYKIITEYPKAVRKFDQTDLKFMDLVKTESQRTYSPQDVQTQEAKNPTLNKG